MKQYGSFSRGYRGVAYDTGGILNHRKFGVNMSGRPERVLSPRQTESFDRLVATLDRGTTDAGGMTLSLRERALVTAVASAVAANQGSGEAHVRVFIGQRELEDIIATQVLDYDSATARSIALGRKP